MARCDSKSFVIRTDQIAKLQNQDFIMIDILDDLASCAKINTRTANEATVASSNIGELFFNAANVPEDAFGCSKNKCYNTGCLQGSVTAAAQPAVFPGIRKTVDATLYAAGLITAYVYLPAGAEKTVTLKIADYTASDMTNCDEYSVEITPELGEGFYPIVFDLGSAPTTTTGEGWTPSQLGVTMQIEIEGAAAEDIVGISSLAFYESIEDLQIDNVVIVTCVDTFGDNQSFDVIEGACSTSEYDPNSGSMTGTVTANKVSSNFYLLNPVAYKDEMQTIGVPAVVTRMVTEETIGGTKYGVIQLSDMIEDDCGFVYIQTPGCANNSTELVRVSSPVPVKLDGTQFQILSTASGVKNLGKILVGEDWIGQELNVIYRKSTDADVITIGNEFKQYNVRAIAPLRKKDGSIEYHLYENMFITTSANNISRTDETQIEIQFTASADENGIRKRVIRPREQFVY